MDINKVNISNSHKDTVNTEFTHRDCRMREKPASVNWAFMNLCDKRINIVFYKHRL